MGDTKPGDTKMRALLFVSISVLLFVFFSVLPAEAATLYLSPATGSYPVDRNFTVSVRVSSAQSMNAADGKITFPNDKLQVVSISKVGSIFNLWVQEPSFSNGGASGNVGFEGVVLNPGFTGDGKILDIVFRVRAEGSGVVNFSSGSVLANDGQGTSLPIELKGGNYFLQKATAAPEPAASNVPLKPFVSYYIKNSDGSSSIFNHSDNAVKWTNSTYARLVWRLPLAVTGVVESLDDHPSTNIGSQSEGLFDSKTFNFLEEGKHYYHIRYLSGQGAGPILHFPILIDLTPPENLISTFSEGGALGGGAYTQSKLVFSATDGLSGLNRYEVKVGEGAWVRVDPLADNSGEFLLSGQTAGVKSVLIRAIDLAGNTTEIKTGVSIALTAPPIITEYPRHLVSPGQKLVIKGTAGSNVGIEVSLVAGKNEPIILSSKSDNSGNWQVEYSEALPSGSVKVTAKQILGTGAESADSNPVYIGINSLFWKFFVWIWNVGGLLVVILTIITLLALLIYYYWHKVKMFRKKLRRQAHEVEETLAHGVAKIKKELERGDARQKISQDLGEVKKEVDQELKDLDKRI